MFENNRKGTKSAALHRGRALLNARKGNIVRPGCAAKLAALGALLCLVIDSGCTWHAHPIQSDLINQRSCNEVMVGADGSECPVACVGDLPIIAKDAGGREWNITIRDVRCVPEFTNTLISVDQFFKERE
jgi:hypothetical protein